MELRHLRYFLAVAEALNFRAAAERLHLSRPALSKQIRELEEEIGVRLLDRNTVRVKLTAAGVIYLQEVRAILGRTQHAGALARAAAEGKRGLLAIGQPGALEAPYLTSALTRFRERFPKVEVIVHEIPQRKLAAAIADDEIQVGLVVPELLAGEDGIASFAVATFRVGVAVGPTHELARKAQIMPHDLENRILLCVGDGQESDHAQHIRTLLATAGITRSTLRGVSGISALTTMVASGHGLSFLPHAAASEGERPIRVLPFKCDAKLIEFELHAIWRRNNDSPMVRNFLRTLRQFTKVPAACAS